MRGYASFDAERVAGAAARPPMALLGSGVLALTVDQRGAGGELQPGHRRARRRHAVRLHAELFPPLRAGAHRHPRRGRAGPDDRPLACRGHRHAGPARPPTRGRMPEAEEDWRRAMVLLGTRQRRGAARPGAASPTSCCSACSTRTACGCSTPCRCSPGCGCDEQRVWNMLAQLPAGRPREHAAGGRGHHGHLPVLQPRLPVRPGPAGRAAGAPETLTMARRCGPRDDPALLLGGAAPRPRSRRRWSCAAAAADPPRGRQTIEVESRAPSIPANMNFIARRRSEQLAARTPRPSCATGRGCRRRRLRAGHGRGGEHHRARPRRPRAASSRPSRPGRWWACSALKVAVVDGLGIENGFASSRVEITRSLSPRTSVEGKDNFARALTNDLIEAAARELEQEHRAEPGRPPGSLSGCAAQKDGRPSWGRPSIIAGNNGIAPPA